MQPALQRTLQALFITGISNFALAPDLAQCLVFRRGSRSLPRTTSGINWISTRTARWISTSGRKHPRARRTTGCRQFTVKAGSLSCASTVRRRRGSKVSGYPANLNWLNETDAPCFADLPRMRQSYADHIDLDLLYTVHMGIAILVRAEWSRE